MEMNKITRRFKVKRQLVAIMILGIPLIGSFQNCGPNNMDFDVDQPALIIDAPVVTRPSEPGSPASDNSGDSGAVAGGENNSIVTGGDNTSTDGSGNARESGEGAEGNGSSNGGAGDTDVASQEPGAASGEASSDGQTSVNSPSINADMPSPSPSLDSPVIEPPISEEQAEADADKSDSADLNDNLTPEEIAAEEKAPKSEAKDIRSNESMSYICRVRLPNSHRVSTIKYKDGVFNAKGTNYRNRPSVVCMSEFSCEKLVGNKLQVHKVMKKKFCERQTKKHIIHMTREDVMRLLENN